MGTPQDIFISYKSEDAGLARTVAEALKALGVKIWFAEYEVLLDNYDEFQNAIDSGIDACQYALLFTSNPWAESRWCQVEIARILQRIPLERIIRVNLPAFEVGDAATPDAGKQRALDSPEQSTILKQWHIDHVLRKGTVVREKLVPHKTPWMVEKDPADLAPDMFDVRVAPTEWPRQRSLELSGVTTLDCPASAGRDEIVANVLQVVAHRTGLLREQPLFPPASSPRRSSLWQGWRRKSNPAPQSAQATTGRKEFSLFGMAFSLDFGSWELTSPGCTASEGGNFNGPTFSHRFDGVLCEGRLVIGEGYPSLQATAETLESVDDRDRYGHLRKFAKAFEQACREAMQVEIEYCGLHIVRLDPPERSIPRTHAAFTCRMGGRVMSHWQRRYSIAITHPVSQKLFEFAFTFDLLGPFDTFLRHAFSMERVVTSLRYQVPK